MAATTKRGFVFDLLLTIVLTSFILFVCKCVHVAYSTWGGAVDQADKLFDQAYNEAYSYINSEVCRDGEVRKNVGPYAHDCRQAEIAVNITKDYEVQKRAVVIFFDTLNPCHGREYGCGLLVEKISTGMLSFYGTFGYALAFVFMIAFVLILVAGCCCRRSLSRMKKYTDEAEVRDLGVDTQKTKVA